MRSSSKLIDMGIDRMGVGYRSTPVVLGYKIRQYLRERGNSRGKYIYDFRVGFQPFNLMPPDGYTPAGMESFQMDDRGEPPYRCKSVFAVPESAPKEITSATLSEMAAMARETTSSSFSTRSPFGDWPACRSRVDAWGSVRRCYGSVDT